MAILGTITKQPREILDVDIGYATVLAGRSDTIVSHVTERSITTGGALTIVSSILTGDIVKITLSAGLDTITYKITILATSSAGLVYEDEFNVVVTET